MCFLWFSHLHELKLSIFIQYPCNVFKSWHHIYCLPLPRCHSEMKHGSHNAGSSSTIVLLSCFKTLGQVPLLLAVAVTALFISMLISLFTVTSDSGTFIDEPHPAQEWVLPGWSVQSTLEHRGRDFCHDLNFPMKVTALPSGSQKKTVAAGAGNRALVLVDTSKQQGPPKQNGKERSSWRTTKGREQDFSSSVDHQVAKIGLQP